MAKYIHVITATKTPENRGSSGTPFEEYETDPNLDPAWGPDQRTMFLPVEEPDPPTYNQVTEKIVPTYTPDVNGKDVRGVYVPGDEAWRFTWTIEAQALQTAKAIKLGLLAEDKATHLAAGYTVGAYVLPLTREMFTLMTSLKTGMSVALVEGDLQPTDKLVLQDSNGKKVELTDAQFQNHYSKFFLAFTDPDKVDYDATEAINDALTLAEVDAVTWDFNA